jgi:predicted dehydrogenase
VSSNAHEDLVSAICELEDGTLVNHEVNWVSPYKERITTVLGTKGILRADSLNVDLQFFENGNSNSSWEEFALFHGPSEGNVTKYSLVREEPLVGEHKAMQQLLIGRDTRSIASISDGVEVLKVLEKIMVSTSK